MEESSDSKLDLNKKGEKKEGGGGRGRGRRCKRGIERGSVEIEGSRGESERGEERVGGIGGGECCLSEGDWGEFEYCSAVEGGIDCFER